MTIAMSESYQAYCIDAAVQLAVDRILDSKALGLPPDIDWEDLPGFHGAVLSAHQVRCEVAVILIELWDAAWQTSLNAWEFRAGLKPRSVADAQEWHGQKFDTYTVWQERWFARGFDIAGTIFQLAPGVLVDAERVQLSLSLWGKEDADHTTSRNFGDDWPEQEIQDGTAWTGAQLAPIGNDGSIDLDPLQRAAASALEAVSTCLQE